jgi:hypothetical protein
LQHGNLTVTLAKLAVALGQLMVQKTDYILLQYQLRLGRRSDMLLAWLRQGQHTFAFAHRPI